MSEFRKFGGAPYAAAVGIACAVAALVSIEFLRLGTELAVFWLPNPILLCGALLSKRRTPVMVAGATGMLAVDLVYEPFWLTAGLTASNLIEVGLAHELIRRWLAADFRFEEPRVQLKFAAALVVAAAASAVCGAVVTTVAFGGSPVDRFSDWFVTEALAMLVVSPLLLILADRRGGRPTSLLERVVLLGTVTACAIGTFAQSSWPLLFPTMPPVLLAAYRLGLLGAAASAAILAAVGTVALVLGVGPLQLVGGNIERVHLLQSYLFVVVASALPIAGFMERLRTLAERLRASEDLLSARLNGVGDVLYETDRDGRWTYLNPAWSRLTGRAPDEDLGQMAYERVPPADRRSLFTAVAPLLAGTADRVRVELRWQTADRGIRWFEVHGEALHDASGAFLGTVGTIRDVDERHAILDTLSANERRFRTLANASPAGIFRADAAGNVVYVNASWSMITGLAPDEALGDGWLAALADEDRGRIAARWPAVAAHGERLAAELRLRRPDGAERWAEIVVEAERDSTQEVIGYVGVVMDVTDRRRDEAAVRESERLYRLLADNVSDIIVRLDLDDRCTYASPSIEDMTGFTPDEAVGVDLIGLIHPDDRTMMRERNAALRAGKSEQLVAEYRTRHKDGRWLWLEARSRLVRDEGGAPREVISVIRDVSDRKALEAGLLAARDEARHAAEAKSNFLATMSHEIRTPITGVIGMVELLAKGGSPDQLRRYQAALDASARTLLRVVDDVLDFSKLGSGSIKLEAAPFDVLTAAHSVLDLYRGASVEKGIQIGLIYNGGASSVVGDATRLRQVIGNLISNAVKFTPAGRVDLHIAEERGGYWRFEVTDTGIGFDPADAPRLFEAFEQADSSTARRFGGTGLGLAIAKAIVQAMGGEIGAEGRPGQGAIFWFKVPLAASSPAVAEVAAPAAKAPGALSVLVAEDNPVNQLLIEAILVQLGHRVTCVGDGAAAVAAAATGGYDAVLMDIQMPILDGRAATRAIRELPGKPGRLPIFALTADAASENRHRYEGLGLDGFLTKPVDTARLALVLDAVATAKRPPLDEASAFDPDRLAELRALAGGDMVRRLLSLFISDTESRLVHIRQAVGEGDHASARRGAHAIKGGAMSAAATSLAAAAAALESADAACLEANLKHVEDEAAAAFSAARRLLDETAAELA